VKVGRGFSYVCPKTLKRQMYGRVNLDLLRNEAYSPHEPLTGSSVITEVGQIQFYEAAISPGLRGQTREAPGCFPGSKQQLKA
jgi:hypothetical protein